MKRKISTLLIIIGILVAAYPLASRAYIWYWENKLLEGFESELELQIESETTSEADYLALQVLFEQESELADRDESGLLVSDSNPNVIPAEDYIDPIDRTQNSGTASDPEPATETASPQPSSSGALGKIVIPKIDLTMPLLSGASEYNLNRGAATIAGTSAFGEIGNVGIAGHRGRSYGIMFNRLDEMSIGDTIEVVTSEKTFKYKVYKTHIVEPTDVTVLYRNSKDQIITLVTCDPVRNPTHRLIVHAILVP
ncbi:MAG: class D sortase [Clostridiales bacterium]|nr:class D sortase [Clostridiales bacterium]